MRSPSKLRRLLPAAIVLLAAGLVAQLAACTPKPHGPAAAADSFLAAFAARNLDRAAAATDDPASARAVLGRVWNDLQAEGLVARAGDARTTGDTATVDYHYEWRLPKGRVWRYDGQLPLGRRGGEWMVRWSSSDIHPKLGDTHSLALRTQAAPRARVNERSGGDVLVPGVLHRVAFDVSKAGDSGAVASSLSAALIRFDKSLTAQAIAESATAAKGPYTVVLLRDDDFNTVRGQLNLPGVTVNDQFDLIATDRDFAPDLIAQVRKTVITEVDGKAGWSVVTVNANGVDTDVLTESPPQPQPSFVVSLDRAVQNAAQRAVDARTEQAMLVAVQPSTGAILAVAQNKAADRDGPIATTGQYPPGSTFKMVTAAAAMAGGLAKPDTAVPCPGRIVIGERSIPNYNEFALGSVPMATAFARSCNTSFAKLASEMRPDALTSAAATMGIGRDYTVAGLPTISGSVPPAQELVQRTEDGFGQGKVLASPFGLALAAATIAHGSTPVPYLIKGYETKVKSGAPVIAKPTVDGLRAMMRLVVTSGTATRIADQGQVYGKTGESEVEGGSHAWFAGYRGDIAFAALVVKGGSSDNAVAITREMFAALPDGY